MRPVGGNNPNTRLCVRNNARQTVYVLALPSPPLPLLLTPTVSGPLLNLARLDGRLQHKRELTPFRRLISAFFCPLFERFLCSRAAFKSATRSDCRGFPSSVISSSAILLPPLVQTPISVATAAARRHRSGVSGKTRHFRLVTQQWQLSNTRQTNQTRAFWPLCSVLRTQCKTTFYRRNNAKKYFRIICLIPKMYLCIL